MGYKPDWQNSSLKKTSGGNGSASRKDKGSLFHGSEPAARGKQIPRLFMANGGRVSGVGGGAGTPGASYAGGGAYFLADGGDVGDTVSFWERLKAGNIDEPGTVAYNRWGEGSRQPNESSAETRRLASKVSAPDMSTSEDANIGGASGGTRTSKTSSVPNPDYEEDYGSGGGPADEPKPKARKSAPKRKVPEGQPDETMGGNKYKAYVEAKDKVRKVQNASKLNFGGSFTAPRKTRKSSGATGDY